MALSALAALPGPARAQRAAPALEALRLQSAALGIEVPAIAEPAPIAVVRDPNDAEAAASKIFMTVVSGMSRTRQALMLRHVRIFIVNPEEHLVDAIERVLRGRLPPQAAAAEIARVRDAYAGRVDVDPNQTRRTPAQPRGFTGVYGDHVLCFVGAENLTASGAWDETGSRARRVLFHELGHATFNIALDDAERRRLQEFDAIAYPAAPDGSEAFAEAAEAWFGVHQSGLRATLGSDRATAANLPATLQTALAAVYGPYRSAL